VTDFDARFDQGGRLGRSPPLKLTKVTLFTMILYNARNNMSKPIPNKSLVIFELSHCSRIRSFCRPLFCHSSVVEYNSPLLRKRSHCETRLSNITEIAPLTLLARSAPGFDQPVLWLGSKADGVGQGRNQLILSGWS